jgi:hypothetical protein
MTDEDKTYLADLATRLEELLDQPSSHFLPGILDVVAELRELSGTRIRQRIYQRSEDEGLSWVSIREHEASKILGKRCQEPIRQTPGHVVVVNGTWWRCQ